MRFYNQSRGCCNNNDIDDFDFMCPPPGPRPCPPPGPRPCPIREVTYLLAQNTAGGAITTPNVVQSIPFTNVIVQNGINLSLAPGTSNISLREAGVYLVSYNITYFFPAQVGDVTATINTYLTLNGIQQVGGNLTTSVDDGQYVTQTATSLINVPAATMMNPSTLQLVVASNYAVTYEDASISVYKIH